MLKLANQVIDAYDDVDRRDLLKLARLNPHVYMMTPEEKSALHDSNFALQVITKKASKLNKYPVNSADNTWLSNQYFELNCHKLPKTAASMAAYHIKEACARFGLKPAKSVQAMAKEAATNVFYEGSDKTAAATNTQLISLEKFAAVKDIGDNYTHAQYAFKTAAHVKLAGKYFDDNHKDMPVEYRHKYAAAIQRRAQELGLPPQGGTVSKYASDHYSGMVDAHIRSRIALLDGIDAAKSAQLQKLGAAKSEMAPAEFAKMLFAFDKTAGFARYYGSHLTDPFLATFAAQPDQKPWRVKLGSQQLGADDLKMLATAKYAKIKDYFGSHVADEFKRDPSTIFDSLPVDAKEIMAGIANGTA